MKKTIIQLLFLFIPLFGIAQNSEMANKDKLKFGLGYSYDLNRKANHHSTHIFALKKKNLIFAGPEFSNVLKPFGDPIDKYEINSPGASFGYQRIEKSKWDGLSFYAQLKFSIYELNSTEYSLGSQEKVRNRMIVENTISGGVRFEPIKHVSVFTAVGFGSTQGFFLMLEEFIPTIQVGVQIYW